MSDFVSFEFGCLLKVMYDDVDDGDSDYIKK